MRWAARSHPGWLRLPGHRARREHKQGFTGARPSRPFPSPVAPDGAPWALPWAPHPAKQDPAAHAKAGTSLRHWTGITPSPSATSLGRPAHHERPYVAHLESAFGSVRTGFSASPVLPGHSTFHSNPGTGVWRYSSLSISARVLGPILNTLDEYASPNRSRRAGVVVKLITWT